MDEEKLHRTCCGEGMEKAVKYVGKERNAVVANVENKNEIWRGRKLL